MLAMIADDLKTAVAAASPQALTGVATIYQEVQAAIDQRKPVCQVSGRCCRFAEFGHRLYVSTLELALFLRQLERPLPPPAQAPPGVCPFQSGRLCTVHEIRPFGCRMFFCDPSASQWQMQHYERFHNDLKALHEAHGVPYRYVEWLTALGYV